MSQQISSQSSFRLNIVLLLLIALNVVNTLYPKGMGYVEEEYVGFGYQLSKYINAGVIAVMLPSLFRRINMFTNMRNMVIMIVVYMFIAYEWGISFNFSSTSRCLLICLSFVFFEETLRKSEINKYLLYGYIISFIINISYLVITQDRLETAMLNEGHVGGGQGIANGLIFLIPLIFLLFDNKLSTYLYLFCGIVVFISLRRTAILVYLLCLPFIYKRISSQISKKAIAIFLILFAAIAYYIVQNYWFVIENRFADMLEANEAGYYGSGRTGWWEVLINKFIDNMQNWLFGFGLGSVSKTMAEAGFPFGGAHNDYIEVIFTYGIIGGYLWFSIFQIAYKLSKHNAQRDIKVLIYMFIVTYMSLAMASSGFKSIYFISIAIFLNLIARQNTPIHQKNINNA